MDFEKNFVVLYFSFSIPYIPFDKNILKFIRINIKTERMQNKNS